MVLVAVMARRSCEAAGQSFITQSIRKMTISAYRPYVSQDELGNEEINIVQAKGGKRKVSLSLSLSPVLTEERGRERQVERRGEESTTNVKVFT